jgi:hypothetical protein
LYFDYELYLVTVKILSHKVGGHPVELVNLLPRFGTFIVCHTEMTVKADGVGIMAQSIVIAKRFFLCGHIVINAVFTRYAVFDV